MLIQTSNVVSADIHLLNVENSSLKMDLSNIAKMRPVSAPIRNKMLNTRRQLVMGNVLGTYSKRSSDHGSMVKRCYRARHLEKQGGDTEPPLMLLPKVRITSEDDLIEFIKRHVTFLDSSFQEEIIPLDQTATLRLETTSVRGRQRPSGGNLKTTTTPRSYDHGVRCLQCKEAIAERSLQQHTCDPDTYRSPHPLSGRSPRALSGVDSNTYTGDQNAALCSVFPDISLDDSCEHLPRHLDSYAQERSTVKIRPRSGLEKKSTKCTNASKRWNRLSKLYREDGSVKRVARYFGGIESFLSWIFSRWGHRKEVQGLSKTSYVMRGDLPHFCNIVQAVSLHDRESSTDDSDGMGFDRRNRAGIGADIDKVPESQQFESVYSDDGAHPDSPVHRGQGDGAEYSSDEFNVIALPAKELPSESIDNTSGILHGTGSSSHDLDNENGDVTITAVDKNGIRDRNIIRIPTPAPDDENIGLDDDGDQRNDGVVDGALTTKRSVSPSKILVAPIPTSSSNSRTTSSFGDKKHKNRACIHKREKKGDKRVKKGKEETIVPAEDDNQHTHDDVTPGRSTLTNNTESTPTAKANLNVPMLPNYHGKLSEKRSSRHRRNSIARHHSSSSKPPTGQTRKTSTGSDITTNQSPYDFPVDNSMAVTMAKNSLRVQPWLHARLALSQEACRFELPMDMKVLETMSPQDYIRRYCVVSPKRQYLYQKIFYRHRDRTDTIPLQSLEKSLKDVLVSTITSQQVLDLCTISEVTSESNIDYKLFCGLSALAERVLYPEYITEETAHLPEHRRDKLECADFSALEWKLKGVNVNPPVHKILKSIA